MIAAQAMTRFLSRWVPVENIVLSNLWSAELAKLAQNAMIAQRISSTNAVSALCEKTGADINEVMDVVGMDSRISDGYLEACPGIGGPTLLQNLGMLVYLCESLQLHEVAQYWQSVLDMNAYQQNRFCHNVVDTMTNVKGKKVAILGFAYKSNTSDARLSPAIEVCESLLSEGADLHVYDPQVARASLCPHPTFFFVHPKPDTRIHAPTTRNRESQTSNSNSESRCHMPRSRRS